jgi:hypothetical protein
VKLRSSTVDVLGEIRFPQWRGLSNGELLHLAEQQEFKVIIVADKNMRHQQNLSSRNIAILELWINHRPTLEQHFQYISIAVEGMLPGQYLELTAPISFPVKSHVAPESTA